MPRTATTHLEKDNDMLNIRGRISALNVRKVVWCAKSLGLDLPLE